MPAQNPREEVDGAIKAIEAKVENGKPVFLRKIVKVETDGTNAEVDSSCRNARKKAHTLKANMKRSISNDVRKNLGIKECKGNQI